MKDQRKRDRRERTTTMFVIGSLKSREERKAPRRRGAKEK